MEIGEDGAGEKGESRSTGGSRNDDLSRSFNRAVMSSPKLCAAAKGVKHISPPERQPPGTPEPSEELHVCPLLKEGVR